MCRALATTISHGAIIAIRQCNDNSTTTKHYAGDKNNNRVLGWGLCKSYLIGFNFGIVSLSSSMFFIVVTTIRCSYLIMFFIFVFQGRQTLLFLLSCNKWLAPQIRFIIIMRHIRYLETMRNSCTHPGSNADGLASREGRCGDRGVLGLVS